MLYEGAAMDLVYRHVPDESPAEQAEARAPRLAAPWPPPGSPASTTARGRAAFAAFQQLDAAGALPVRVLMLLALATLRESIAVGLRSGFGGDRLRVGPVKIFSDGSLGSQTAEMLAPFEGTPDNYGVATIAQADLEEAILAASGAGIAVAVHAIGDAANRRVLDAFARARQAESGQAALPAGPDADGYALYAPAPPHRARPAGRPGRLAALPRARRHRLDAADPRHLGHGGRRPALGRAGRAAAPTPGAASSARARAWPSAPIARWRPSSPCSAFTPPSRGRTPRASPPGGWYPQERLSVAEAVRAYTPRRGLRRGRGSTSRARWTPGKLADFVLLDQDIFHGDPAAIATTRRARHGGRRRGGGGRARLIARAGRKKRGPLQTERPPLRCRPAGRRARCYCAV